jgi:hypothetical protein
MPFREVTDVYSEESTKPELFNNKSGDTCVYVYMCVYMRVYIYIYSYH